MSEIAAQPINVLPLWINQPTDRSINQSMDSILDSPTSSMITNQSTTSTDTSTGTTPSDSPTHSSVDQTIELLNSASINGSNLLTRTRSFTQTTGRSTSQANKEAGFVHRFPSLKPDLTVRINQSNNQQSAYMVHRHLFAKHSRVIERLINQPNNQSLSEILIDDFDYSIRPTVDTTAQSTNPFDSPINQPVVTPAVTAPVTQPTDHSISRSGWFAYFNAIYELEGGATELSAGLIEKSIDRLIDCAVAMESPFIIQSIDQSMKKMLYKHRIRFHENILINQSNKTNNPAMTQLLAQDKEFLTDLQELCKRADLTETLKDVDRLIN